jgi:hypothetical protein
MNRSFMRAKWNDFFVNTYSESEWACIKISMVSVLCLFLINTLFTRTGQPFPTGICSLVNCACLTQGYARIVTVVALVVLSLMYIFEIQFLLSSLLLFVLAVVILSIEEANGNPAENGLLSLVFFAQFLAYLFKKIKPDSNLVRNRMQFSAQIFAAAYVLSAISKLWNSGIGWFTTDAPKFALEVLRVFNSRYITYGDIAYRDRGYALAGFLIQHLLFTKVILALALLIELFAFVLMINKKLAFYYAFLLLALHLGIYLSLGIFFPTVMLPMMIFFINPLYWLVVLVGYVYRPATS